METGQDIYVTVLKQSSFLSGKPQFLLIRPSSDWMRPTHIIKGNFFFFCLKFTRCIYYSQNSFATTPKLSFVQTNHYILAKFTLLSISLQTYTLVKMCDYHIDTSMEKMFKDHCVLLLMKGIVFCFLYLWLLSDVQIWFACYRVYKMNRWNDAGRRKDQKRY